MNGAVQCPDRFRADMNAIETRYRQLKSHNRCQSDTMCLDQFKNLFHPLMANETSDDISFFFVISDVPAYVAQYGVFTEAFDRYCAGNFSSTGINNYAGMIRYIMEKFEMSPIDADMTNSMDLGSRAYNWLSCNDFGTLLTAYAKNPVRSRLLTFDAMWEKVCKKPFKSSLKKLNRNIAEHNARIGNKILTQNVRLIMTQGSFDPYSVAASKSVTLKSSNNITLSEKPVSWIATAYHGDDNYFPADFGSQQLRIMQEAVFKMISEYIKK